MPIIRIILVICRIKQLSYCLWDISCLMVENIYFYSLVPYWKSHYTKDLLGWAPDLTCLCLGVLTLLLN